MEQEMQQMLNNAVEAMNRIDDPELHDMIRRFDYTPTPEMALSMNDHMKIYNWLRELELYHKLCGPLDKV